MEVTNEVIRFLPNVPVRMKLKFDCAKPCKSKYSEEDQFMLSGEGNKLAFLTPYAHSKFEQAGFRRGDQIEITQTVLIKNQRKTVDWVFAKVEEQEVEPPADSTSTTAATVGPVQLVAQPQGTTTNTVPRAITQLEDALRTAIYSAQAAEKFSVEIGYPVKFDKDDVRNLATTVLIGMQQQRRTS